MRHATCRRAVLEQRVDGRVSEHLDRCAPCAAFARSVQEVVEAASSLAPPGPPPGLADRVLQRLREPQAGPAVVVPVVPRRPGKPVLLGVLSAAAALALVAGTLASVRTRTRPQPERVLLAAAKATSEVRTARMRFEGAFDLTFRLPEVQLPTPPAVPAPELPPLPSPDLQGVPEEWREQVRQQLEEARRRYEEQRQRMQVQLPSPIVPRELRSEGTVEGTGEIALPDRLHVRGAVRGTAAGQPVSSPFEVIVAGGRAWMRQGDGPWVRVPGPLGPFGPLVLDPGGAAALLRAGRDTVTDLGEEDLDGERVRHYRFRVPSSLTGPLPASATAEAWVGVDDRVLRRLTMTTEGKLEQPVPATPSVRGSMAVEWRTTATLRLFDFGAEVTIEPPPETEVSGALPAPAGSSAVVYPFGYVFSVSSSSGQVVWPPSPAPSSLRSSASSSSTS